MKFVDALLARNLLTLEFGKEFFHFSLSFGVFGEYRVVLEETSLVFHALELRVELFVFSGELKLVALQFHFLLFGFHLSEFALSAVHHKDENTNHNEKHSKERCPDSSKLLVVKCHNFVIVFANANLRNIVDIVTQKGAE